MNNDKLQTICRDYLHRLKGIASEYGLGKFIDETIALNKQEKCQGTEEQCNMMARILDEERLERKGLITSPAYGQISLTLPRFYEVISTYVN